MKKRTTKRALIMSFLALLLCCSMLIGMTYAWFTDNVTSGTNKILAGKLDIDVTVERDGETVSLDDEHLKLFDVDAWEPGVVAYETLTIKNAGNLALKYDLYLNVIDYNSTPAGHNLTEVIKVAVIKGEVKDETDRNASIADIPADKWDLIKTTAHLTNETLLTENDTDTVTLVAYWEPTDHDNDYNLKNELRDEKKLYINFSVVVAATQAMEESDSFGDDYDEDATVPGIASLTAAINQGAKDSNAAIINGIIETAKENGETITPDEAAKLVYFDDALQYDSETGEYTITLHFEKGSMDYVNVTYNAVKALIAEAAQKHATNVFSVNIAYVNERIVKGDATKLDKDGQWVEDDLRKAANQAGGLVQALEASAEYGVPVEFVDMNGIKQVYRMFFELNWNEEPIDNVTAAINQGAKDSNAAIAEAIKKAIEENNDLGNDVGDPAKVIYFDEDGLQEGDDGELAITLHFDKGSINFINEAYDAVKMLIEKAVTENVDSISSIQIANGEERTDFTGEWLEGDLKAVVGGQGGFAGALNAAAEYGLPVTIKTVDGRSQVYRMNFDLSGLVD